VAVVRTDLISLYNNQIVFGIVKKETVEFLF
jgi:hypothetical protein